MMVASTLSLNESISDMIHYALDMLDIPSEERDQYLDETKYPLDRLMPLFQIALEKNLFWKFRYANPENYNIMDLVMAQVNNPNYEFSNRAFSISEYYDETYKKLVPNLSIPVLLFYGKKITPSEQPIPMMFTSQK